MFQGTFILPKKMGGFFDVIVLVSSFDFQCVKLLKRFPDCHVEREAWTAKDASALKDHSFLKPMPHPSSFAFTLRCGI